MCDQGEKERAFLSIPKDLASFDTNEQEYVGIFA